MCVNRTFSELNGKKVSNKYGNYSIRYVMENDSPRFVLKDVMKSLGYKSPNMTTHIYCKMFNLGKVCGTDNNLYTYASKEQMEEIFKHLYLITDDFRDFWNNVVIPETDQKYAVLRERNQKLIEMNRDLTDIYETLKVKNSDLAEKLEKLLKERDEIVAILKKTA